jgi:transcription elongation factor GreB
MQAEDRALWLRRRDVTKALAAAAAEGDRSENAEYIYRKKELREIDRRIRYLQKRMPDLKIVELAPPNPEQVFFGAWVTLENDSGEETTYRIVGADEFDPEKGWVSVDAPMAQALLKKFVDDEIQVRTPSGISSYTIAAVRYSGVIL